MDLPTDAHKRRARSITSRNTSTTTCGTVTVEPAEDPGGDPEPEPDPGTGGGEDGGLGTTALLLGLGAVGAVGYAATRR